MSLLCEFLIITTIVTLVVYFVRYKRGRRHMEELAERFPGPYSLPVVGNIFYFMGTTHAEFMDRVGELRKRYAKETPFRFWLGNTLMIGIYEPKDFEAIFSNPKVTDKGPLFGFFQSRSRGAFTLSGEPWKKHRKFTIKMFHSNLMEHYVDVFNEQSRKLVDYLKQKPPTETFNVAIPIMRCTLDTICRTAFGTNMELQSNHDLSFPDDLTISSEIVLERMYKPWLHPQIIFDNTKIGKEMHERVKRIHDFTEKTITKRRIDIQKREEINRNTKGTEASSKPDYKLFVDYMFDKADEEKMSDRDIAIQALDIVIGGADTSAIADSYVLLLLGMHPEWQEALHREVDLAFGGDSERDATASDLARLDQLEMVIKEVLRLYTAPHALRRLHEDIELENYTLPAGASLYLGYYAIHRDPRYWSHPDRFYPQHFLPENVAKRPKYSYMPFSHGPRSCPGSKYGMVSMKIVLSHILRKFRVECDLKFEEMRHKPSLMLELVGGYRVRLIQRTQQDATT